MSILNNDDLAEEVQQNSSPQVTKEIFIAVELLGSLQGDSDVIVIMALLLVTYTANREVWSLHVTCP